MNEKDGEAIRVDVCNGKYTYVQLKDGGSYALRYGEVWIEEFFNVPGCGMTLYLAYKLDEARKEIIELKKQLAGTAP